MIACPVFGGKTPMLAILLLLCLRSQEHECFIFLNYLNFIKCSNIEIFEVKS